MKTLAIIGGGAAGLAAAVAAGERLCRLSREHGGRQAHGAADVRITVYEADDRAGRTILATGNGRCNFSNAHIDAALYRNPAFVDNALLSFELRANREVASQRSAATAHGTGVLGFFADHGMLWREEGEGRLYPLANKASVVLDVLRAAAAQAGVQERCGARVERVELPRAAGKHFTLRMADGAFERADAVVVACGGRVTRAMLPETFAYADPRPVLGPLATDTRYARQLDNIRVKAALELRRDGACVHREEGEVLFRKYGVSGVCVFNMSRLAHPGDELAVDFLPAVPAQEMPAFLGARRHRLASLANGALSCGDFLRGMLLPQVAHVVLERAGLREGDVCDRATATSLAPLLKGFTLTVEGIGDARQCQVHRGGLAVDAFDVRTLEAQEAPGLYAVGEALDVDAPCGGYNLHWAWASGLLAGWSAADALAGVPADAVRRGEDNGSDEAVGRGSSCAAGAAGKEAVR